MISMSVSSYLDGVPVLAGEGVDGLLLETLLALGQSLVPIMKITISALSPFAFRDRRIGRRKFVDSVLEPGQLTHLPTAIFAKSYSQRRIIVVGRVVWKRGDRKYWTSGRRGTRLKVSSSVKFQRHTCCLWSWSERRLVVAITCIAGPCATMKSFRKTE